MRNTADLSDVVLHLITYALHIVRARYHLAALVRRLQLALFAPDVQQQPLLHQKVAERTVPESGMGHSERYSCLP